MKNIYSFNYNSLQELEKEIKALDLAIPVSTDLDVLAEQIVLSNGVVIPNRLAVHPMEGCDSREDGSPGQLTERRYLRYAEGGAGLIWLEAVAVNQRGRANNQQLFLHRDNYHLFADLTDLIRERAKKKETDFRPYLVLQLTHSGRFGQNKTILFNENTLDQAAGVRGDHPLITDRELEELEGDYVEAARLAKAAGFDAIDLKSCHGYFLSEMLAAHTRDGKYGGDYLNRTCFIKNVFRQIKAEVKIDLAIRLNIFDGIEFPYGWGTDRNGGIDWTEPKRLVQELAQLGVTIFNVTASTPYLKPHLSRPYDQPGVYGYPAPEHPLFGVNRLLNLARVIQGEIKDSIVVGTGYSWLREFSPYIAAGVLRAGWAKIIGFGREAFAYPDFADDILFNRGLKAKRVCITCSKCTELKAAQKNTGCVVRDPAIYLKFYQELLEERG